MTKSTRLPPRTVRYALTQIEELGAVTSRISIIDVGQRIYSLELTPTEAAVPSTPVLRYSHGIRPQLEGPIRRVCASNRTPVLIP